MRKVEEIGLLARNGVQPFERIVGQFVGDVALSAERACRRHSGRWARQVRALASEADPFIEAGLRLVAAVAHVPLADECGLIAGLLQQLRKEAGSGWDRSVVVDDLMPVGVNAGQNTGAARRAQRRGDEGILQVRAFPGDQVHIGRAQPRLRMHKAHGVVPVIVGQNEDHVSGATVPGLSSTHRGRGLRHHCCSSSRLQKITSGIGLLHKMCSLLRCRQVHLFFPRTDLFRKLLNTG